MKHPKLLRALINATADDLADVQGRIRVLRGELRSLRQIEEALIARFRPAKPPPETPSGPTPGDDDPLQAKPRVVKTRLAAPADEKKAAEVDKKVLPTAGIPAAEPKDKATVTRLYQQRLAAVRYLQSVGQARPVMIANNCDIPVADLAQVFRCDWFVNVGDYIGLTAAGKSAASKETDQNCQPGRKITV